MPDINPMKQLKCVSILFVPAVIPTKPANMPFAKATASYFFDFNEKRINAVIPPQAADKVVVTAQCPATSALDPDIAVVLPALNPNQPNHRISVPRHTYVKY